MTLVVSLVRLPDNYLHLTESERVLRNEQYFSELIDLSPRGNTRRVSECYDSLVDLLGVHYPFAHVSC